MNPKFIHKLIATFITLSFLVACSAVPQIPVTSGADVLPEAVCCEGQPLEAGTYTAPEGYAIPFQITLGDGWRNILEPEVDSSISLVRGPTYSDGPETRSVQWLTFIPLPENISPEEAWEGLRTTPGLLPEPDVEVTIAGMTGVQFDAVPETEGKSPDGHVNIPTLKEILYSNFSPYSIGTESLDVGLRFILLPIHDQHLIIYMEAPRQEFEALTSEADRVIQTIQFQ